MRGIVISAAMTSIVLFLPSCEGCVKNMSKKATEVAISAVEGVSEAVSEHGEVVGQKVTDALGLIAMGAGKSIDSLLVKHADGVAATAGQVLVQSFDGFTDGIAAGYYDKIGDVSVTASKNVVASVELLGKISAKPVVDAYLIIDGAGAYEINFVFEDANGFKLIEKSVEATAEGTKKYTLVSFALTDDELAKWAKIVSVKIKIDRKQTLQ